MLIHFLRKLSRGDFDPFLLSAFCCCWARQQCDINIYHSCSLTLARMQFFPPKFCIFNVIGPRFTRLRKSKATLKPGNQQKRLQSLKMAAKSNTESTRVMPFFVENPLPVTLLREVSDANLSEICLKTAADICFKVFLLIITQRTSFRKGERDATFWIPLLP